MSPRIIFAAELEQLKQAVLEMTEQVVHNYEEVIKGTKKKDVQILKQVIENDHLVNDMQRAIEARCLTIITKQAPVAKDLRLVSASLKVVTDIERIGDHASDIAELIIHMGIPDLAEFSKQLENMFYNAVDMIGISGRAFAARDMAAVSQLQKLEEAMDGYFGEIREEIVLGLKESDSNVDGYVDALMIAKYLERVGDHAVNICEWEGFQETGIIEEYRIF